MAKIVSVLVEPLNIEGGGIEIRSAVAYMKSEEGETFEDGFFFCGTNYDGTQTKAQLNAALLAAEKETVQYYTGIVVPDEDIFRQNL